VYRVADAAIGRRHRMSIGTIVADAAMLVRYANGGTLGTIEESFIARLRPGDVFTFAGKRLELVGVREMTAFVAPATSRSGAVPRWAGTKLPLSTELADALLAQLEAARAGRYASAELRQVRPLLELQARWSSLPTATTLVAEALRAGRVQPATFSIAVNDYGFELLTPTEVDWHALWSPRAGLLAEEGLLDDVLASLNAGELAQRRFREIARVAGLIFQGYPGAPKSVKQLQASSGLFYEVLRKYDAGNLLLGQADREVLEQELDLARIRAALAWMRSRKPVLRAISRPTPFAFPLLVERLREQLSTEKLADRVARMVAELERRAGAAD
jgi:ATP-dependent Lhr-like helicase